MIKIFATLVIIIALGLEIANFLGYSLGIITWLAHLAIISHLIEAIIAVIYAPRKNVNLFKLGLYIFFTGTIGLKEIFSETKSVDTCAPEIDNIPVLAKVNKIDDSEK